jgi:hypothetical protein
MAAPDVVTPAHGAPDVSAWLPQSDERCGAHVAAPLEGVRRAPLRQDLTRIR